MGLLQQVTDELDGDEAKALDGLGALFMTIRLQLNGQTFETIARELPLVGQWITDITGRANGQSGEMLTQITPQTLPHHLSRAGFSDDEVDRMGEVVSRFLSHRVPSEVTAPLQSRIPLLASASRPASRTVAQGAPRIQ